MSSYRATLAAILQLNQLERIMSPFTSTSAVERFGPADIVSQLLLVVALMFALGNWVNYLLAIWCDAWRRGVVDRRPLVSNEISEHYFFFSGRSGR